MAIGWPLYYLKKGVLYLISKLLKLLFHACCVFVECVCGLAEPPKKRSVGLSTHPKFTRPTDRSRPRPIPDRPSLKKLAFKATHPILTRPNSTQPNNPVQPDTTTTELTPSHNPRPSAASLRCEGGDGGRACETGGGGA